MKQRIVLIFQLINSTDCSFININFLLNHRSTTQFSPKNTALLFCIKYPLIFTEESFMQTLSSLLRLSLLPHFGAGKIQRLLEHLSLEKLLQYDAQQLRYIGWTEPQIQAWFSPNQKLIDEILTWQEKSNHHIISLFDPQYPFLLTQIKSAPPILFVKGNINALSMPQIAIVGSRYCSPYGEYCTRVITQDLSSTGFTITSGLALGIDSISHQTVLDNNGLTIAVLGCGLNTVYPTRHKRLAQQIVENEGALVSEFTPNTPPIAENFPRRNRIISGLSFGSVIIEASTKSGSLITARYALEQNREVFAIPGAINSPLSQGCHQLIKQGAWLVEDARDILEIVASFIAKMPTNKIKLEPSILETKQQETSANILVPKQHYALYQLLNPSTAVSPDELAIVLSRPIGELLTDLLELEMLGLAQQTKGGYVRCC